MLIRVDLPAPFSPMMPWMVPPFTLKETSRLAWTWPNCLLIFRSSIAGDMNYLKRLVKEASFSIKHYGFYDWFYSFASRSKINLKNPSAFMFLRTFTLAWRFVTPHQSTTVIPMVNSDWISISTFAILPSKSSG